ncbi:hypothetical protein WMY93_022056 [Mugilogobius chulae]|uniref:Cadherin-like beta sandwich domain-containing protein n=1 Tax=Mugilogobius chulae TaxID=88201 RepID=A0AAW0NI39_9GOBI
MRCVLAFLSGLLLRESGMLARRRLHPGPLLLLGVALCLFYQTFNVAWHRLQDHHHLPRAREHGPGPSDLEESWRIISALEALQAQVESVRGAQRQRALVLTGQHVITDTEVQLYMRVLQKLGYEVQLSRYAETSNLLRPKQGMSGLSVLLCLSSSETNCLRRVSFSQLNNHQRVNLIPQMMEAFSDAGDGLCHMFTHAALSGLKIPMRRSSCASGKNRESAGAISLTKPEASSQAPGAVVNAYVLWENLKPEVLGFQASYQDMIGQFKRIIQDVLQAAAFTTEKGPNLKRCLLCYQLLTFTLLFNASLTPTIIQKITKDLMLEDMLHFLLKPSYVTKAVDGFTRPLGVSLSEDNQLLLLKFYQQLKSLGPFQLLNFNTTHCSSLIRPRTVDDLLLKTACYSELHQNHSLRAVEAQSLVSVEDTPHRRRQNALCVDPQLRQIYTDPPLSMTPLFDPRVREYRVEVPFDTVMVRIRPEPFNSNCRVHLDELHGPSMANLPIGLGHSRISILLMDGRPSATVMTIYTLHVYRESRPSLPMFGDHVTCSFTQECSLLVQPDKSCGLELFNKSLSPSQPCSSGDKPGRWVVPCLSCSDSRTCDWREIVWQPDNCYYPLIDRLHLQSCMTDRKLLFIGDSTNRGMMYFLMERVNSSLEDWEKAHDTLVYSNLNGGRTLISYSYYPQFWLESKQRPTFTESLEKLLDRSKPLLNSRHTVLVVGGVQWLNTKHLRVIRESLKRKGLNNILVVVKSLGMGFHLLVDGVRSLKLVGVCYFSKFYFKINL